jgi:hypothetical protein
MRGHTFAAGALAALTVAAGMSVTTPAAHASNFGNELNGTYRYYANGDFAMVNEVKKKMPKIDEVWTVVDRNIPEWQFCPDGLVAPGEQRFQFWGFEPMSGEREMTITNFLVGRQRTVSPSGSCGRNQPLVIETPMKLEQLS